AAEPSGQAASVDLRRATMQRVETGLRRCHANQVDQSRLSGGGAGDVSTAGSPRGDSRRLAAQARFAGNLLYGGRVERKGVRPRLHPRASAALAREHGEHQIRANTGRMEESIRNFSEEDRLLLQIEDV